MLSEMKFYALTDEPTIVPFLYSEHLNCCLEGTEQTSLLLLSSLMNKRDILSKLNSPSAIIIPAASPDNKSPARPRLNSKHPIDFFMKTSYTI